MLRRRAGILLHPTSMPGPFPVGDLGSVTGAVLDWVAEAGLTLWQTLPLGPTSFGESPYGALSSFAGNPLLISPERLQEDGLLPRRGVPEAPVSAPPNPSRVPFEAVRAWKDRLLRASFQHAKKYASQALRTEQAAFEQAQGGWLEDWALFVALKQRGRGVPWVEWPAPLRDRESEALTAARRELGAELAFHRFAQWVFFRQWAAIREAARTRGILILGDLPIYVAHDSADVWAHRALFRLDEHGAPEVVAGVPPDYFSALGQRWGNPLYAWEAHRADGFAWWIARVRASLALADAVRLAHFRGFSAAWEIPATEPTAGGPVEATPGRDCRHSQRAR